MAALLVRRRDQLAVAPLIQICVLVSSGNDQKGLQPYATHREEASGIHSSIGVQIMLQGQQGEWQASYTISCVCRCAVHKIWRGTSLNLADTVFPGPRLLTTTERYLGSALDLPTRLGIGLG